MAALPKATTDDRTCIAAAHRDEPFDLRGQLRGYVTSVPSGQPDDRESSFIWIEPNFCLERTARRLARSGRRGEPSVFQSVQAQRGLRAHVAGQSVQPDSIIGLRRATFRSA